MTARRWAAAVAILGTVFIGVGAFWLSFRALSDLAVRAGVSGDQGWVWAAIVDGVIVTSTVAAVALDGAGWRATWFAWLLLALSAGVSVVANVVHALVSGREGLAPVLVGSIAAVPPLVLLAMTHLTVVVVRHARPSTQTRHPAPVEQIDDDPAAGIELDIPEFLREAFAPQPTSEAAPPRKKRRQQKSADQLTKDERRERAEQLHREGMSNAQIAAQLDIHRSTVGRWFLGDTSEQDHTEEGSDE